MGTDKLLENLKNLFLLVLQRSSVWDTLLQSLVPLVPLVHK